MIRYDASDPVHLPEMVTEDTVGNCQREDFGFIPDTPDDQLPVVYPVFIDDPDENDRFQESEEFDPAYSRLGLKDRIIMHQKGLDPFIVGFAGVNTVNDLPVTLQETFAVHRRYEIDGVIRIVSGEGMKDPPLILQAPV